MTEAELRAAIDQKRAELELIYLQQYEARNELNKLQDALYKMHTSASKPRARKPKLQPA